MARRYVETADAVQLDWQALGEMDQGGCYLVSLSWAGLSVLLSLLRYATWRARWRPVTNAEWQDVQEFVQETEACLLMGCDVRDLITTQRLLIGAITGTVVDLDEDLPTTGTVDFTQTGLATKFVAGDPARNLAAILADLQLNLGELQTALETQATNTGELEDDLANVWFTVKAVATILGASVGAPPIPL
jgi:hypothetical protein